jgi:O-antigen biosynthesis protein
MHRSGTSPITRALRTFGIELGDRLMPAVEGVNDKGFYEDLDIVEANEELLQALSRSWDDLALVDGDDLANGKAEAVKLRAIELLRRKTRSIDAFGMKDPRMARLIPFWKDVFARLEYSVGYVIAIRNPLSVARSLFARDKFEPEKAYLLWLEHVVPSIVETTGEARVVVDFDRLMERPSDQIVRMARSLGFSSGINPKEIELFGSMFLEQGLRHTIFQPEDLSLDRAAPPIVRELFGFLTQVAVDELSIDSKVVQDCIGRALMLLAEMRPGLCYISRQDVRIRDLAQLAITQHAEMTQLVATQQAEILKTQERLNRMRSALSWRISRPLRSLKRVFRRSSKS